MSKPDRDFIPYGKQEITDEDINSVIEVLKSDFLTQGPTIKKFEDKITSYTGAKYAVAVNSNTSGLHIACLALGLNSGDLVWTSPITFAASANCARFCGAEVDFIDIDINSFNISLEKLEQKLISAEKKNKLPKILIPVHMCGMSCDMQELYELSQKYGFKIIEDSAHAIGAKYQNKAVGSTEYSDLSVFSFHPVKIITTGEGGVVTTNDKTLYDKLLRLRTHGITKDPHLFKNHPDGNWYHEMHELSHNYRITDIQAALGLSQMDRLDKIIERRNEIARYYQDYFSKHSKNIEFQKISEDCLSSYHLFPILVDKKIKKELFEQLQKAKIGVNLHYIPVYYHPYYQKLGYKKGLCPNAEIYYDRALSIPLFPQMTDEQITYIAENIVKINHSLTLNFST